MYHTVLKTLCQFSKSQNEIVNKINLNSEAMIHNTWTLPNSVIQSKSPKNAHSEKITSTLVGGFHSKLESNLRCISK
jgi:hypothetical protein